jgi:hypothetical protein
MKSVQSNRGYEFSVGEAKRFSHSALYLLSLNSSNYYLIAPDCLNQQIDTIKKTETSDLPLNDIHILEGDPFTLPRNIGTRSLFIKYRRCRATQAKNRIVVFQFKNGETMALTKTSMEKTSNGMKFMGCQLFLLLILAGTVLRSQGMTLQRPVIDCHMKF